MGKEQKAIKKQQSMKYGIFFTILHLYVNHGNSVIM
jgi:hypothetical protein